jgi:hypothetical protein
MTDYLKDQAKFMAICRQTVGQNNPKQTVMYETLLAEEHTERLEAIAAGDVVEEFDADLDILVVHLGRMLSRWPVEMIEAGWAEVMRSNLSKAVECPMCAGSGQTHFDPLLTEFVALQECVDCNATGYTVQRREDGKVLKPASYSPPDLKSVMEKFKHA